jgi:hypothetical protein
MWLYNKQVISSIEDMPPGTFGFIYMTTHTSSGISYIGKKSLYHNVKRKLTKKELADMPVTRGRKVTTEIVQKESDWKTYSGSAKPILEMLKEGEHDDFTREIIQFVFNKKLLTYYECKYLFKYGVLEHPLEYFNDNILGKFYTKDFVS